MRAALSAITVGDPLPDHPLPGITAHPLSFTVDLTPDAFSRFLSLINLSGYLTVGDALTAEERHLLFRLTEEDHLSGLLSLERFLSLSLFDYALDPRAAEQVLLQSFPSETFQESFLTIQRASPLHTAERAFGDGMGKMLRQAELVPLRFLELEKLSAEETGGRIRADITLHAYSRAK